MSTLALQKERNQRIGVIVTLLFHILLIIFFLFFGLNQPDPIPHEHQLEVAMVDFGIGLAGSGNVVKPPPSPHNANVAPITEIRDTPEEAITDDHSEVMVTMSETHTKPMSERAKLNEPALENKLAEALNSWEHKVSGGGQGESSEVGSSETSFSRSSGLISSISQEGVRVDIDGRKMLNGPNITDRPNIERRSIVVISIKVDRDGKVTDARDNLSKSNTTSQVLFNIAKKAARQASFTTKPDGPYEQQGEMTFIFDPQ
jgi:periplasmic protein TonB